MLIYDSMDFQVSEVLHEGSEYSHNYDIGYIIITSYLPNNRKKVNCYWGLRVRNVGKWSSKLQDISVYWHIILLFIVNPSTHIHIHYPHTTYVHTYTRVSNNHQ